MIWLEQGLGHLIIRHSIIFVRLAPAMLVTAKMSFQSSNKLISNIEDDLP